MTAKTTATPETAPERTIEAAEANLETVTRWLASSDPAVSPALLAEAKNALNFAKVGVEVLQEAQAQRREQGRREQVLRDRNEELCVELSVAFATDDIARAAIALDAYCEAIRAQTEAIRRVWSRRQLDWQPRRRPIMTPKPNRRALDVERAEIATFAAAEAAAHRELERLTEDPTATAEQVASVAIKATGYRLALKHRLSESPRCMPDS